MSFLRERYAAGELIVFQAVSSPYRDRSHFDGQNVLENGLAKPIGTADGWLNRAIAALPRYARASDAAVAVSQKRTVDFARRRAGDLEVSPGHAPTWTRICWRVCKTSIPRTNGSRLA